MRQCWVIPNGRGEPWVIDTDETKPVYLKNGIPTYKVGEMFNYHLANEPPGEERCQEIEKGCEGYQFTFEDFAEDEEEEDQEQDDEWERFRDKYCKHQRAWLKFDNEEHGVRACCYKDERSATCWADWQKCLKENCPFIRKGEQDG